MNQHEPWSESALSALFDDELNAAERADQSRVTEALDEAALARWVAYQEIRDGLRHGQANEANAFLDGFRAKLAQDPVVKPVGLGTQFPVAANDESLLRWKLLAGFSSCLAVGVLMWASWGGQSHGDSQLVQATPQIAPVSMFAAPYPKLAAETTLGFSEVIQVQEPEGSASMLRDPALDDLLRAHGAVSSSHAASFFRSATFSHDGL